MKIAENEHLKKLEAKNDAELERLHRFIAVKQSIAEHWFYGRYTLRDTWEEITFSFSACSITVSNDSNDEISFSWDGINLSGELLAKETMDLCGLERNKIYLKTRNLAQARIWAF